MIDFLRVVGLLMGPNPSTILELRSSLVPLQPNRILIHKLIRIRFVIPEEVVMQPRLTVGALVLQAEGLVCAIRYSCFFFQTPPAGIVAEPQEVAVFIGHLFRYADLVTVEVAGLLLALHKLMSNIKRLNI